MAERDRQRGTDAPTAHEPYRGRQPQGEHKCTVCGAVFERNEELRDHELKRHPPDDHTS